MKFILDFDRVTFGDIQKFKKYHINDDYKTVDLEFNLDDALYRYKKIIAVLSENAPSKYKWAVMDCDGAVYAYTEEPEYNIKSKCWNGRGMLRLGVLDAMPEELAPYSKEKIERF